MLGRRRLWRHRLSYDTDPQLPLCALRSRGLALRRCPDRRWRQGSGERRSPELPGHGGSDGDVRQQVSLVGQGGCRGGGRLTMQVSISLISSFLVMWSVPALLLSTGRIRLVPTEVGYRNQGVRASAIGRG